MPTQQAYGAALARSGALYLLVALTVGFAGGLAFPDDEPKQRLARGAHISGIMEGGMMMLAGLALFSGATNLSAGMIKVAYFLLQTMWIKNAAFISQIWLQCAVATPLAIADAHVKNSSCTPQQGNILFMAFAGTGALLYVGWAIIAFGIAVPAKRKAM